MCFANYAHFVVVIIEKAIQAIVSKFCTSFTLLNINPSTRVRRVRSEENITAVYASVNIDRDMSIRRRSQQLGLCNSTTWKITVGNIYMKLSLKSKWQVLIYRFK